MKKILTVSLFAIMAVSAANAEIASVEYVGKQTGALADLQTDAKANLVGAINEVMAEVGTVSSDSGALKTELQQSISDLSDVVDAKFESYSTTAQMNTAITEANNAQTSAITTAYEAADATTLSSARTYADGLASNYDAAGSAAQALTDAKAYTDAEDKRIEDTIGTVETGKTVVQMINEASAGAGTALTNALQDYSTTAQMNTAITEANNAQTSAITTAYEAADATTLDSAKQFTTEQIGTLSALSTVPVQCASGVTDCALVIRSGTPQWEKVSY